jgi:23S rRNA (cytosine1962-C5)-methyltransferase
LRVWTTDPDEPVDHAFFESRLTRALKLRRDAGLVHPDAAWRLCHAESDGLPGVIVDIYGAWAVMQVLSAGAEWHRDTIAAVVQRITGARGVFERSDLDVRTKEGLQPRSGLVLGDEPPELIEIRERDARFAVNVRHGHKTGFYLDQRANRAIVAERAAGRDVLNVFCYTGGFGIACGLAGAKSVLQLDESADALALAEHNAALNQLGNVTHLRADAFRELRAMREAGRSFDLVVLDPPKFAGSAKAVESAMRGYKEINMQALHLLRPEGILATFSCSGHMDMATFQDAVADAAADAGRRCTVLKQLHQDVDHPFGLHYPEGEYLKGLLLQVD